MASPTRVGLVRRGSSNAGESERFVIRSARAIQERGHSPVLFTSSSWQNPEGDFQEIHRLPGNEPGAFAESLSHFKPRNHCDILLSFEPVSDCDFFQADTGVHRSSITRRSRHAASVQKAFSSLEQGNSDLLRLEKHLFSPSHPCRIIATSELVRFEIQQLYGKPARSIDVIYGGYKPPAVRGNPREEIRERLGLTDRDTMVLFASSNWERSGLASAVRAVRQLGSSTARLFVAGSGSRAWLPRGPVSHLGPVEDLTPYFEAADLFLFPTFYDPFSTTCLKAAAHGLPVITTTSNGFAEIMIHGHQGEAVEDSADIPALVKALRLWLSADRRAAEREQIRQWARQFHIRESVRRLLDLILKPAR